MPKSLGSIPTTAEKNYLSALLVHMYDRDNVPWKMCRQDKALAQSEERKAKQGHLRSVPLEARGQRAEDNKPI